MLLSTMRAADAGRRRLGGRRLEAVGADVRTGAVTTVLVLVQVVTALVTSAVSAQPVDAVTGVLFGVVVASLVTRELVHRRQRSRLVDDLREQALHDPLTGLGNRHALSLHLLALVQEREGDEGAPAGQTGTRTRRACPRSGVYWYSP